jgi:hypothetical protein
VDTEYENDHDEITEPLDIESQANDLLSLVTEFSYSYDLTLMPRIEAIVREIVDVL